MTEAKVEFYGAAGVLRVGITRPGLDLEEFILRTEARAAGDGSRCFQWFVNLGLPDSGAVVDLLRARGCFLGGLIPRWFDDDALLMQKLLDPPGWDRVQLSSEMAHTILTLVPYGPTWAAHP